MYKIMQLENLMRIKNIKINKFPDLVTSALWDLTSNKRIQARGNCAQVAPDGKRWRCMHELMVNEETKEVIGRNYRFTFDRQ